MGTDFRGFVLERASHATCRAVIPTRDGLRTSNGAASASSFKTPIKALARKLNTFPFVEAIQTPTNRKH